MKKAVALVGGAAALTGGGYVAVQSSEVSALKRTHKDQETKVFLLRGKARGAESAIAENEGLIKALSRQAEQAAGAADEIGQKLAAARTVVQQLEAQQQQQDADLDRTRQDLAKAHAGLEQARADAARFREDALGAERALAQAGERLAQGQRRLNPLNHPRVMAFTGRRGGD